MLRNPRERLVSAYATVISRGGVIGVCGKKHQDEVVNFKSPPFPNVTNSSLMAWNDHFIESLFDWVTILKDNPVLMRRVSGMNI